MITPQEVDNVLNYFYKNNDNRSTVIAKHFKITLRSVDYIIDLHLSRKKNYNGIFNKTKLVNHGNCKSVIAYNSDGDIAGTYKSIKECVNESGVSRHTIKRNLSCFYAKTQKGFTFEYKE